MLDIQISVRMWKEGRTEGRKGGGDNHCGLSISDTDFHGYISTDLLIHPWLFPSPLPPLEFWVCVLISESLCWKWLSLFFSLALQDICYFFPLLLISLSIFSSKVHHCGDHWPNFIISRFFKSEWTAHFIFVPHLFKISSVIGPRLGSVSGQLEEPLQWTLGYIFPFEWLFFCAIGPDVSIRILGLAVLKFFLLACGGCPFKGLFPMSVPRELERGSFILVHQFSSVAQLCLTLCDPMDCSTPGLPVHHQLPEFTQTHVHRVGDAIQPSHPLSSPFPSTFDLS